MSGPQYRWVLESLQHTQNSATDLMQAWQELGSPPLLITLRGDLGAGKTEWVRSALRTLGHEAAVPSPTYSLVVPYEISDIRVLHLDLYRLGDSAELDELGLDEDWSRALIFIEWPERGGDRIPQPDLQCGLQLSPVAANPDKRELVLSAGTPQGEKVLLALSKPVQE